MPSFAGNCHDPEVLREGLKVSAVLDSILEPVAEARYHRFHAGRFPGTDLGVVNNGAGDDMFCFFSDQHGSLIKGFHHGSDVSPHAFATGPHDFRPWPGMYEETPQELLQYLEAPEFNKVEVTFCIWQRKYDQQWSQGKLDLPADVDDGSSFLLGTILLNAESYLNWARYYYGKDIPQDPVREVYATRMVSRSAALAINSEVDLAALDRALAVIGLSIA